MRQLARRISRVADSSASPAEERRGVGKAPQAAAVPEGHVPVHVGEGSDGEAERFLVRTELLGRPALAHLLGRAAQEYGYGHQDPMLPRRLPPGARGPRALTAPLPPCRLPPSRRAYPFS